MEIKVRLFAILKEKSGFAEKQIRWTEGLKGGDVLHFLKQEFQELDSLLEHSLIAINGRYAKPDEVLLPDDEVAVLPPVSGG